MLYSLYLIYFNMHTHTHTHTHTNTHILYKEHSKTIMSRIYRIFITHKLTHAHAHKYTNCTIAIVKLWCLVFIVFSVLLYALWSEECVMNSHFGLLCWLLRWVRVFSENTFLPLVSQGEAGSLRRFGYEIILL